MKWYRDSDDQIRRESLCVLLKTRILNIGHINQSTRFSFISPRACDYNHIHATLGFSVRIMVCFTSVRGISHLNTILGFWVSKKYLLSTTELFLGLTKIELSQVLCINIGLTFSLILPRHKVKTCPGRE